VDQVALLFWPAEQANLFWFDLVRGVLILSGTALITQSYNIIIGRSTIETAPPSTLYHQIFETLFSGVITQ
jgi:hypothetical protein